MKATQLLETQHRQVEQLFQRIEGGESAALTELANSLVGHMAIEQEIFYPAVHAAEPDKIAESFEEHSVAELALKRALRTDPSDDQFDARVKVLKELILHHVEEEEQELFPAIEKKLSADALDELAAKMSTRFDEVVADGYAEVLPEGFEETSADAALDELEADEDAEEDEATGEDDDDDDESAPVSGETDATGAGAGAPKAKKQATRSR